MSPRRRARPDRVEERVADPGVFCRAEKAFEFSNTVLVGFQGKLHVTADHR